MNYKKMYYKIFRDAVAQGRVPVDADDIAADAVRFLMKDENALDTFLKREINKCN